MALRGKQHSFILTVWIYSKVHSLTDIFHYLPM